MTLLPFTNIPADKRPLPSAFVPLLALTTPFRVLSNLLSGQPTMDAMAQDIEQRVRIQGRKWNKTEAGYVPFAPVPPLGWRYECGRCRFYESASKTCTVMGLPGDPFGGESVHPIAWCAFFLPRADQPLLRWVAEFVDPSLISPRVGS